MSKVNVIVVYKWECAVWCGECGVGECGSGRMWEWEIVDVGVRRCEEKRCRALCEVVGVCVIVRDVARCIVL